MASAVPIRIRSGTPGAGPSTSSRHSSRRTADMLPRASRSKWMEFKGIANATPGITVAAIGKDATLKFTGTAGHLVLFMNEKADAGAYAAHQGSVCVRATVTP